jgi:tRNA A-37 threonylcarbamoyl transferase component Bud32
MPPMTGRVIAGRYILEQPIGRGAMGMVWRAHDQLLDREVAVKEVVLSAAIGEDERKNAYQRTLREARTAARLSHRGVVTVFDVAEEDGRPWIVMELVPSRSLDQVLASEGPMTPLRAGRIGQQLLAALAAAHAAGVLHRDVKPSNVLIATDRSGGGWDERAVLTDFGIAQFEGDPRLTQTGMVMGSPGFTAPERIRGCDATPASDLWSLGATIYAAVEGHGPYEKRGGAITTMTAIINEDAPIASSAGQLAPLIGALLRREPSERPSASAAARMFSEVLPLLPDEAAHPATMRSAHVPAPAGPVVSIAEAPQDAGAPAVAPTAVGAAEAAADSAQVSAAAAEDVAASAGQGAVALAGAGAAMAEGAGAAGEAVPATPDDRPGQAEGAAHAEETGHAEGAGGRPAEPDAAPGAHPGAAAADAPEPTELSIPAVPPAPPQPKPTFTAAKHAERAGPSFSPSQAALPVPPQPAPPFSASRQAWRADPPTTPAPAYESAGRGGPDAYYGAPGAQYTPRSDADAQYAGPSQPYPDLVRQYAPGTGGRARRRYPRGRMVALIAAALVAAAAIGGGAAYALRGHSTPGARAHTTGNANLPKTVQALDSPSSAVPAGWIPVRVLPSDTATTAGFTIDMPPGWSEKRAGLRTFLYAPDGVRYMDIDLTRHTYANMVNEATYIERQSVAQGRFPDYRRATIKAVPIRGTTGAFWQFTWLMPGDVKMRSDDILFIAPTQAGPQSYAIYFRSPDSIWNSQSIPLFQKMLRTFQTVPG